MWEDCGIAGASSTEVTVDHTCTGDAGLAADLKVEITDVCFPSCEEGAPVFVAVQVRNQGGVDVSGTVPLAVYAGAASAGSGDVPLHTFSHTGGVTAGSVAAGQVIDFDVRALNGQPIRIEVNDDGTGDWAVQECDLLNNQAVYDANPCPATE